MVLKKVRKVEINIVSSPFQFRSQDMGFWTQDLALTILLTYGPAQPQAGGQVEQAPGAVEDRMAPALGRGCNIMKSIIIKGISISQSGTWHC